MSVPAGRPVELRVFSIPAHLPVVRGALEKMCELLGFESQTIGNIILSVDEAMTNIIRHAYEGADDKPIEVQLAALDANTAGGIRIRLRDYGRTIDRSQIKGRDLADVRPGGLGVHLMNRCMDKVEYASTPDGGTHLTMVKLCKSRSSQ